MLLRKIASAALALALSLAATAAAASPSYLFKMYMRGINGSASTVAENSDPYFANVASLLPLNSATGTPPVTDAKGGAWTPSNLSLSSTQFEVGTGSLMFDTSTSWASGPAVSLTGDFTIELWVYPTAVNTSVMLVSQWSQASASVGGWAIPLLNGVPNFSFGAYSVTNSLLGAGSVPANAWSHIAITRQSSTFREFVNGALVQTATFSGAGRTLSVPMTIGNYFGTNGAFPASGHTTFQGYMQQIRVTDGVARYTSSFTPPAVSDPTQ